MSQEAINKSPFQLMEPKQQNDKEKITIATGPANLIEKKVQVMISTGNIGAERHIEALIYFRSQTETLQMANNQYFVAYAQTLGTTLRQRWYSTVGT